jgi:lysophospholipase L1-like esterase
MKVLSAYGHSWVDSSGSSQRDHCMAELAALRLDMAIRNEGVAGSLSADTALVVRRTPPVPSDVFLLMTGLNDARLFGLADEALRDYAEALRGIFRAFDAANPRAVVIALEQPHLMEYSLHPPYDRGSHESIDAYNDVLRRTCDAWPFVLVVPVRGWCARTMLTDDGVHPNRLGNAHLARAVVEGYAARSS